MQKIEKQLRQSYAGEKIVTELVHTKQSWVPKEEFVPNTVTNNQISNQAVVIGNGPSRKQNDLLPLIKNHRAGLLGANRLQSYGCNALYREFEPDFLVCVGKEMAKELANSGYCENHVVYANADVVLDFPRKFYLIPQNPAYNAGTLAVYLACFDGHKKVFLYGFDGQDSGDANDNVYAGTNAYAKKQAQSSDRVWIKTMAYIMKLYSDVEFVRVMPSANASVPEEWKDILNFRQVDRMGFALEADL
jgi:hypothetical protein